MHHITRTLHDKQASVSSAHEATPLSLLRAMLTRVRRNYCNFVSYKYFDYNNKTTILKERAKFETNSYNCFSFVKMGCNCNNCDDRDDKQQELPNLSLKLKSVGKKDAAAPRGAPPLGAVPYHRYALSIPSCCLLNAPDWSSPGPLTHPIAACWRLLPYPPAKPRPSPTLFFFPGLDSRPWHDTSKFPWVQTLEENRDTIRDEFLALRDLRQKASGSSAASDYNVNDKEHQLHEGQWDWLSYVTQGRRQADFALRCPKTVEILESIPGFMAGLPFAYSFFSVLKPKVSPLSRVALDGRVLALTLTRSMRLRPQSSIKAHSAPCNIRLRCHFPLFVPDGCGIRVGDEVRKWEEGKALVLDGTSNDAIHFSIH